MDAVILFAKLGIPRGYRKKYNLGSNNESEDLSKNDMENRDSDTPNDFLQTFIKTRKDKWLKAIGKIDIHSSSSKS